MRYSIIMNTIDRSLLTRKVFENNLKNSGVDRENIQILINDNGSTEAAILDWASKIADVHLIQGRNIGNAQGLNLLMENVTGDVVAKLDNDIILKNNWLKDAGSIAVLDDIGLIGFHWGHNTQGYHTHTTTKVGVFDAKVAALDRYIPIFGSWVFSKRTWDDVGYFNEFSKYGRWDGSYGLRCLHSGRKNLYLVGYESTHAGTGSNDQGEYRQMKDQELVKANLVAGDFNNSLTSTRYHVNKNQELVDNG